MRFADPARVQELRDILADINSADKARLIQLYITHIGYNPFEDNPEETIESAADTLADFVREVCCSEGIHCADVFGADD